MILLPKQIKLTETKDSISIRWNDNSNQTILLSKLRRFCPCAVCLTERENQSPTFIPIFSGNQVKINSIKLVGNYAIQIIWEDGHNTGIYEFPFLKSLSENLS